jgi:FKBP-type peptidyl-prolyl cis-trans isomerase FklB
MASPRGGVCHPMWRIVRAMNQVKHRLYGWTALCVLTSVSSVLWAQTPAPPPQTAAGADPGPAPSIDQTSYLFGLTFGAQLHGAGITNELSNEAVQRGIRDGLNGRVPTNVEMQQLQTYVRGISEAAAARNEAAAAQYLARNAKEKGVISTASGLQYKVIAAGDKTAPPITASDQVTVNYRGKLLDGTEFDSSYGRGPATFPVNGVIKGWQEALVLMKPGGKYQLFIPPALAYGPQPKPKIPAGSLLIFDVDLISAQSPGSAAPAPAPKSK